MTKYKSQTLIKEPIYSMPNKKEYITPEYKIETTMTFIFDALKDKQSKVSCRQCSSCHGCR